MCCEHVAGSEESGSLNLTFAGKLNSGSVGTGTKLGMAVPIATHEVRVLLD